MISFTIPGEPQGKARARTGKGFAYTPEKTVNYEALIKQIFQYEANKGRSYDPTEKAIEMLIVAFYGIPKSTSKTNRTLMYATRLRPTKKPDVDNIAKIVCDALNKIAYRDDTQVVKLTVEKYYANNPRVEVYLKEVEG